jgi:hypothetical protein
MGADDEPVTVYRDPVDTGVRYEVPGTLNRIPPFDPASGEHFWVMPVMYHVGPDAIGEDGRLNCDMHSIALVNAVGCYYCEELCTAGVMRRRCKGTTT